MKITIRTLALLSLLPVDVDEEQHAIAIGDRQRNRGKMLTANAERARTRVRVTSTTEDDTEECAQHGVAIGQCGCGTAGRTMMASTGAPTGRGLAGSFTANPPGGGGGRDIPTDWLCRPGCYPEDATPFGMRRALLEASRMGRTPYIDPRMDAVEMDTLVSDVTAVGAGLTVNIEVSPVQGTFAAFYWEIVAIDPTTQVSQVDWRADTPRVEGCPVPCQTGTGPTLSQFVTKVPEACCGQPGVFWLDKRSEDSPLVIPFTNNQAAGDLHVQVRLRGYCCSSKIC